MRYGAILTAIAVVLLVACKSTTPPTPQGNQPPPVQYEQGPQARSTPHALFTPGIAVAPIQHSPWTTTTNDPSVTLQAQQPVSISTTSNISLYAPSLIAWTNAVNGRLNVCNTINGIAGAVGNGSTDCTAAITNAQAVAVANNNALYFPPGVYLITNTVTLLPRAVWIGDVVDAAYKSANPKRAVIKTSGDFTALQSPRLTFPNDWLPFWSQFISIQNLYIEGVLSQSTATNTNTSVGLDLTGTEFTDVQNVHIEGFGTGLKVWNGSEIRVVFPMVQNNYLGMKFGRDFAVAPVPTYDMMADVWGAMCVQNWRSLEEWFPRSVNMHGGEFVPYGNSEQNIAFYHGRSASQANFFGSSMENHAAAHGSPMVLVDTNGIGQLTFDGCNFETDGDMPLVEVNGGYVDVITLENSSLQRSLTRTNPIVWLHAVTNGLTNDDARKNEVHAHGNTPGWYDTWIRNDLPGNRPEQDFVPSDFVNLNPLPNVDHINDGLLVPAGNIQLFSTNTICGRTHLAWLTNDPPNNTLTLTLYTNATRGNDALYFLATLYDNGFTNVPQVNLADWGTNGVDYLTVGPSVVGQYTNVAGATMRKFAWSIILKNLSLITNGLGAVELVNFFGDGGADRAAFGIERFCVYAPRQKNGFVPIVPPFGIQYPAINSPGTYAIGYGINYGWPFALQMDWDADSIDHYICFNCFIDGGTKANPTFTASNSGGRIIRIKDGAIVNDGILEIGHTTTGTGQIFVLDMQVDSELTTNALPILVRDNLSLTMKRILMDTNRFLYLAP